MKRTLLSQPRLSAARRAETYRPRLELLEGRLQPGSLLFGSMLGAGLLDRDPGSLGSDRQPAERRLVRHAGFFSDAEASHAGATAALFSGAARSAERSAPVTAAPVVPASAFGSSLADDLQALGAIAGRSVATPATPVAVHAAPQAAVTASTAPGSARHPVAGTAAIPPDGQVIQAAPLTPAAMTATLRPVAVHAQAATLRETVLRSGDPGQVPPPAVNWSTYLGGDNYSFGQSIDQAANGDAYIAGSVVDPTTGAYDVLLVLVPQANPSQATEIAVQGPNNDNLIASTIAVQNAADGSTAAVYVTANDVDAGVGYILQLSPDLQTVQNSGGVSGVTLAGLDLGENDPTAGVYVTGAAPDPSGSGQVDTVVAELSLDLSTVNYSTGVALAVGSTPLDSQGNAIQVDSAGNTYEALTVGNAIGGASTDNLAGWLSLSTGAAAVRFARGVANPVAGLNGAINGVEIQADNPQGFLYVTGTLNNGHATPLGTDMFVAKVNATTGLPTGGYSIRVNFDTNGTGDIAGAGIEVDGSGNAYIAGAVNLAPDASGNVDINGIVFKLNPAGNMILNERIIGNTAAGTSNEDHALGIALGQDDNLLGDVCVTGWTSSDQTTAQFSPAPVQAVQGDLGAAGVNAYAYCENQPIGG